MDERARRTDLPEGVYSTVHAQQGGAGRGRARAAAASSGAAKPRARCDGGPGRHRGCPDATGTAASTGGGRHLRAPAGRGRDAASRGRAVRTMEELILLDTTELLRVMPRKLHAAWSGTKVRMPPAVADELAPAGVLQSRTTAISVAEELLQPAAPALADERRQQLERQAWWAVMWRATRRRRTRSCSSPPGSVSCTRRCCPTCRASASRPRTRCCWPTTATRRSWERRWRWAARCC